MGIYDDLFGDDPAPADPATPTPTPTTTTTPAPTPAPAPAPSGGGGIYNDMFGDDPAPTPAPATSADQYFQNEGFDYNQERGIAGIEHMVANGTVATNPEDEGQLRDLVGSIARLYHYGDEEEKAAAVEMGIQASSVVPSEWWAAYGLAVTETEDGFMDRLKNNVTRTPGQMLDWGFGDNSFGNYVGKPLAEALSYGQQRALLAGAAFKNGNILQGAEILAEAVAEVMPSAMYEGDAVDRAMADWDLNGDGLMEFAEVLGKGTNSSGKGGWFGGVIFEVANFVGGELFDPLNYIAPGGGTAVSNALRMADDVIGPGTSTIIRKKGLDGISDAQQATLGKAYTDSLNLAFGSEGRRRTAVQAIRRMNPDDIADEVSANALRQLQSGRGLDFAGVRVPGSQALRNLPGSRQIEAIDPAIEARRMDEVTDWLDDVAAKLEDAIDDLAPGGNMPTGNQGALFPTAAPNVGELKATREMLDKVKRAQADPSGANLALLDEPNSAVWKSLGDELGDEIVIPLGAGNPNKLASEVTQRGPIAAIRESRVGQGIGARFAPRTALRAKSGTAVADQVYRASSEAAATSATQLDDMLLRVVGARKRAAKETAGGVDAADSALRRTLQSKDDPLVTLADGTTTGGKLNDELVADEVAKLRAADQPAAADYLEILADQRRLSDEAAVRGGLDADRAREGYFPRVMTEEGYDAGVKSEAFNQKFQADKNSNIDPAEQKFQKARTYMPDASVESANKAANAQFGLGKDKNGNLIKLFEEDPLTAYAMRSRSAFNAAAHSDMLDKVVNMVDEAGLEMAAWAPKSDSIPKSAELRRMEQGHQTLVDVATPRGTLRTTPEMAQELSKIKAVMYNDATIDAFRKKIDEWSQIWGTYATVPLSDGFGFHMRNAYGNLMLNMTAGVTNPAVYLQASRIQNAATRARRAMVSKGVTFEDAINDQALKLSKRNKDILRGARANGAIGTGFFDDLSPDMIMNRQQTLRNGTFSKKVLSDNFVTRTGRDVGSAVENNARLGHYIDRINKGDSAEQAASSVRRYLFDYGDLTAFERNNMRSVSRFYTFMRKNTALQTWAMVNNPAGMGRQLRTHRALMGNNSDDGEGGLIPDWARGQGTTSMSILSGSAVGLESVFGAALEPYQAAMNLLDQLPGLKEVIPGEASGTDTAGSLLGLVSGGPVALADFLYETLSGQTWYGKSTEDRGTEGDWMAFADVLAPLWGPVDRVMAEMTGGELEGTGGVLGLGNNPTSTQKDLTLGGALLKNLLGFTVVPLGESAQSSVLYALNEELNTLLDAAEKAGHDIGNVDDLRRLGIAGDAPGTGDSVTRASSSVLSDSIDQMRETGGTVTPEILLELDELRAEEADQGYRYTTELNAEGEEVQSYTTRSGRAKTLAEDQGWLNDAGNPSLDFRTKAAYNRDNPADPFLDSDGNAYSYSDWQDWVEEDGVQYQPDGGYTTRSGRGRDLAAELNIISVTTGEPSLNNLVRAEYNKRNPDDPFLNRDGEAYTYADVAYKFPGSTLSQARDWLIAQGANISPSASSLRAEYRRAYNEANPDNPYYEPREWIENGELPVEGVYTVRNSDTGETRDFYPQGMSASNWWIGERGQSALGAAAPTGSSALSTNRFGP